MTVFDSVRSRRLGLTCHVGQPALDARILPSVSIDTSIPPRMSVSGSIHTWPLTGN